MVPYPFYCTRSYSDTTASLLRFDIIVYAKVGDGLDWVRYSASFDNALLSDRGLYIQNLNYNFDVVFTVEWKSMEKRHSETKW